MPAFPQRRCPCWGRTLGTLYADCARVFRARISSTFQARSGRCLPPEAAFKSKCAPGRCF
eukprot:15434543-Alexandrium_andersonii.AAC.1